MHSKDMDLVYERRRRKRKDLTIDGDVENNPGPNKNGKKPVPKQKKPPQPKNSVKQRTGVTPTVAPKTPAMAHINYFPMKGEFVIDTLYFLDLEENLNRKGAILSKMMVNFERFPGTVAYEFNRLYQMFTVHSMHVSYTPVTNAFVAGQLCLFSSADPFETIANEPEVAIRQINSFKGARIFNAFDNCKIEVSKTGKPFFYCSPDSADPTGS